LPYQEIIELIRQNINSNDLRFTLHAQSRMEEENIRPKDVIEAMLNGLILENYPEHKRGPCCLVCGYTKENRPLHIVCTTSLSSTIIITVYEPKMPKFLSPTKRNI